MQKSTLHIPLELFLKIDKLLGSVSDGDIRRYLVKTTADITSDHIQDVMHKEPFSVEENKIHTIKDRLLNINRKIKYAFITDSDNNYLYSIELNDFYEKKGLDQDENIFNTFDFDKTIVVGLGFVGLTLAAHIAKSGYPVIELILILQL